MQEFKRILEKLKEGDREAYKFLFNTFYPRLFSFSLKYVEDKYVAEGIVSNTFLKVWEKRNQVTKIENLRSYLYSMVRNESLDYIKKRNKEIPFNINSHDSVSLMNDLILEEEVHSLISNALESLPPKCREIFKLSCIDGVKYKVIAKELQITVNTVKSQRARAIKLLKLKLKDYPF